MSDSVSGGTSGSGATSALDAAKLASAGSSPSREVQEIMAHNDYYTTMEVPQSVPDFVQKLLVAATAAS